MARLSNLKCFFDQLIAGTLNASDVRHSHNPDITKDKLSVITSMLETPESVTKIVKSVSREFTFFFGTDDWCVGVTEPTESINRIDPDIPVFFPRSLRKGPIGSKSVKKEDADAVPITGFRIIPPR